MPSAPRLLLAGQEVGKLLLIISYRNLSFMNLHTKLPDVCFLY